MPEWNNDMDLHDSVSRDEAEAMVAECQAERGDACNFVELKETDYWFSNGIAQQICCRGTICYLRAKIDPLYKPLIKEPE